MFRGVPGEFLPEFQANSSVNASFVFNALAGRQFVLAFIGTVRSGIGRKVAETLLAEADRLAERRVLVYPVTSDRPEHEDPLLVQLSRRFTVFWDSDHAIARLYGMEATPPTAAPGSAVLRLGLFVARLNLRLHGALPISPIDDLAERLHALVATLPKREPETQICGQAPVLLIPDVPDVTACREYIEYFERQGGVESGFMRDIDGQTKGILDPKTKRRQDVHIVDAALQKRLRSAIIDRVVPEIRKAFAYNATRIERYVIGCYDEADQGFFGEHRDNRSKATAHRAFAVSLNLNSDDYEGGTLRFPEYGPYSYKPGTGGAVVFSCSLLHEATPVTRGRRYAILPFLYDDAAAVTRGESLQFLSNEPPLRVGEAGHA